MNGYRILAVMSRHLVPTLRDPMRLMDMFYWPLLDIVLWGFTSLWLGTLSRENPMASTMLLSGLVMWQVVFRSSIEVTRNMLEELWHENFINLFASPLTFWEWIVALLSISFINSVWNLLFGASMVYWFFSVNVFALGIYVIPFYIMLLMFGWFCGLMACAAILRFGRRVEMIAWSFPWFFSTFSCVFYPLHVLPPSIQNIALWLPTTHVFENIRRVILLQEVDRAGLIYGAVLSCCFLLLACTMIFYAFRGAQNRGLNSVG